jgi:Holliday junction DNA helicase RuvA
MISQVHGKIIEISLGYLILDVSGIGYKINTTIGNLNQIKTNQEVVFYTHLAIRENSHDLFGFLEKQERDFFEILLTISGIGPKSALAILNTSSIENIREGVASGDSTYFSKISGIGKKTAEKISHTTDR